MTLYKDLSKCCLNVGNCLSQVTVQQITLNFNVFNQSLNSKINDLHKRSPWMTNKDNKPNFDELLGRDCYVSNYHQNI